MRKYIGDFYVHYFRGEGLRYSMPALAFSRIIIFTVLFGLEMYINTCILVNRKIP